MAAVEVPPHTTSHLGMSKHDFSKNPAVNASSGDGQKLAQLANQIGFNPLSEKEIFGEPKSKFLENAVVAQKNGEKMNKERCESSGFHNLHAKAEQSSSSLALLNKSNIQECVENAISEKSHQRVTEILNKVSQLSNAEKLFLYLKLPTGNSEVPLKLNPNYPLGNRTHVSQAFTWIRTHLDEDNEVSLQKDEVYQSYKAYCSLHEIKVLSQADFGKAIKQVFPNVKPRRLGMRGHSKYCYSGLCKRKQVPVPILPDLEELRIPNTISNGSYNSSSGNKTDFTDEDLINSSSRLICEWAYKLLNKGFDSIHQLAYHLVSNCLVSECSVEAISLVSHFSKQNLDNSNQTSILLNNSISGNKHKDAQLQLQRKLQEKERIKEQKRKIIEYQSNSSKTGYSNGSKTSYSNSLKTGLEKLRTKKCSSVRAKHGSGTKSTINESTKKSTYVSKKISTRSSSANDTNSRSTALSVKRTGVDLNKNSYTSVDYENSIVSDTSVKNPEPIQSNQNGDKCIIIVPSIQLSNTSKAKPKYKPIQPKPKLDDCVCHEDDFANMQPFNGSNTVSIDHIIDPSSIENSGTAKPRLKRPSGSNANEEDAHKKANVNNINDCNHPNFNQEKAILTHDNRKISQLRKILESNYTNLNQTAEYANASQTQLPYSDDSNKKPIVEGLRKPDDTENTFRTEFKFENSHLHSSSFQFTPISNKTMPASESLGSTAQSSLANSPIPNIYNSNQPSTNLFGPQTNDSPFVSPRETPLSRSRNNSGHGNTRSIGPNHSSDGSVSPFASPLGTPVHTRSRHGSGAQASVLRFSATANNNRYPVTLPSVREISNLPQPEIAYTRSRHMSANTLLPLSKSAPMSPMYSQFSNSQPDLTQDSYQKHVKNEVAYQTFPNQLSVVPRTNSNNSQELKMYLQQKNPSALCAIGNSRCQSVPLCQMLNEGNLNQMNNQNLHNSLPFSKSYPATPCENQEFNFPTETEQFENYLSSAQNIDYTTSEDTLLQMPYSANPVQTLQAMPSFSDQLVDICSTDNYNQSNQLLFNSQNPDLADCSQHSQRESAYNEVLQGLEENFSSSTLSQLDEFISI